jgi:molybdopterin converting factor small subunit
MKVKVLFSGFLAQVARSDEKYYPEVKSIIELRFRILDEFPEIAHYDFSISLNNVVIYGNTNLNDGDEVKLLPAFSQG